MLPRSSPDGAAAGRSSEISGAAGAAAGVPRSNSKSMLPESAAADTAGVAGSAAAGVSTEIGKSIALGRSLLRRHFEIDIEGSYFTRSFDRLGSIRRRRLGSPQVQIEIERGNIGFGGGCGRGRTRSLGGTYIQIEIEGTGFGGFSRRFDRSLNWRSSHLRRMEDLRRFHACRQAQAQFPASLRSVPN
jgi:hypothetical protein